MTTASQITEQTRLGPIVKLLPMHISGSRSGTRAARRPQYLAWHDHAGDGRTRDCHRFDRLVLPEEECEAAQGSLRAIIANMDVAIEFGAGTPGRIAENLAMLRQDGMAEYIWLMFPAGT